MTTYGLKNMSENKPTFPNKDTYTAEEKELCLLAAPIVNQIENLNGNNEHSLTLSTTLGSAVITALNMRGALTVKIAENGQSIIFLKNLNREDDSDLQILHYQGKCENFKKTISEITNYDVDFVKSFAHLTGNKQKI